MKEDEGVTGVIRTETVCNMPVLIGERCASKTSSVLCLHEGGG